MLLISDINLYDPEFKGKKDILIGHNSILAIHDRISLKDINYLDIEHINGSGKFLIPGLIDSHIHIAGAGGEGGPASRTPEIQLSEILKGGITSVVGCLGTDGITKDVREVLMKAKGLREEGISAWIYTGAYQVPPPSVTGDYARDIALIEEVIGLGEIALSDHRSSTPDTPELIKMVEHTRVAGMLSGKAGIVNIHMGDAHDPFKPIYEAVNNSELPIKQFYPTHCNRNEEIFQDAKQYGRTGYIDLTASSYPYFSEYEIKPSKALNEFLKAGVPLENITISSDANGSLPGFDKNGNLVKLEKGMPDSIWTELKDAVLKENISMDKVLKIATENVANILKLKNKGRIIEGFDADCLIVDKEMNIHTMISKGKIMIKNEKMIARGTYE